MRFLTNEYLYKDFSSKQEEYVSEGVSYKPNVSVCKEKSERW